MKKKGKDESEALQQDKDDITVVSVVIRRRREKLHLCW